MTKFISKRVGLALITLLILSAIVFILGNLLPGDPGRSTLGPLAPESAVKALDHQYGTDKPLLTQYWLFISHFVQGNMGMSNTYHAAVRPLLFTAIGHSLKLAVLAFVIVVPLGIFAGVFAALHVGKAGDRAIVVAGTSATVTPEIVSGIFLILVFGIWLNVLPISATPPAGAGFFTQIYHLILPAIPLVLVLFGYIARMARAGNRGSARLGLRAHSGAQGAAAPHRDPAPRAAQLAAAHDHGDRQPDRLSDRGPVRG